MIWTTLVCSMLLLRTTEALQLPTCCTSRLVASRVLGTSASRAAVCLCAAEGEEGTVAEAAEVPAAAPEAAAKPARAPKGNKTPLEELEAGAEVEGTIRSVMNYGAFVDIGAATDGLLHVSEISNEFVKDATEKLTAGEKVTCRIKAVNIEKQQLALTCKDPNAPSSAPRKARPDLSEYEGADEKAFVGGKVNSITDFGAFVTLKEGVDGLVHISQIQEGGVKSVGDVLAIGQEVQVRVVQVDAAKRRIGLSMKPWSDKPERNERPQRGGGGMTSFGEADKEFQMSSDELETLTVGDDLPSPFEAAFERATVVQKAKEAKGKYAVQVL